MPALELGNTTMLQPPARRLVAETWLGLAVFISPGHKGLEDCEENAAVLGYAALLADHIRRNPHQRIFGDPPEPPPRLEKIKVKLADGKERTIQHMMATSFWSPDGKPMSAAQFIERLFGDLPALFQDEAELRKLWSRPDTRRKLLDGLVEKGYGQEQLAELARMIDAEKSDLYDVLAYIAYAQAPISRQERVAARKALIFAHYIGDKQQEFLDFVLDHYVTQGVGELDQEKLPNLLELKYHAVADAVAELGAVAAIRDMFIGFQEHLYVQEGVA